MEQLEYDKDRHIASLETINQALVEKIADMVKRKMARNSEAAVKWRGKAFYWKRKYEQLLEEKSNESIC